ncbi:hypothetical protein IAT38_005746 [Cryptococcus sp. DSM 104549]
MPSNTERKIPRHASFGPGDTDIKPLSNIDPTQEKPDTQHLERIQSEAQTSLRPVTSGGDTEKASTRYAGSDTGLVHKKEQKRAERKLLLKLDVAIIPFAVLLYLCAYLDRSNLGNARLQGLQDDVLDGSSTKYSIALSMFFIMYIICPVPGTLLSKRFLPSRAMACGALIWSIAASCQAAAHNPASLYVCRLFVGVGEAMFGPAMGLHLSYWYTKTELAKRIGMFISAGAVSGAFGGLIAFGVSSIKNSSIAQWRILFLIEGLPGILLAVLTFLFMPSRPEWSRYLNEEERTLCLTRMNRENNAESQLGVEWGGVKRCMFDWKTYVIGIPYACMNLALGSVGGFLPTIIRTGFGYSAARSQLFTVPPYAVALVFMLLLASYSDHKQTRGIPAAVVFILGIVGWALLLALPANTHYQARYFACILVVTSAYTNIPIFMSWQASNTGSQSQRATSLGMLNTVGQCLSLAASFLFPDHQGPQYRLGASICLGFQTLGLVITLAMSLYYRWENRRRDKVEGGRPPKDAPLNTMKEYDRAVGFRYVP